MTKNMEQIVALCKRRGFIFQSSEIYGGIQGFWDYGPLGTELKRNVREAWWREMVTNHNELAAPEGAPRTFSMLGLETSIIMHPQVWKCCGHYDMFHDMMVDCRETKKRYRFDHILGRWVEAKRQTKHRTTDEEPVITTIKPVRVFICSSAGSDEAAKDIEVRALKYFGMRSKQSDELKWLSDVIPLPHAAEDAPSVTKIANQSATVAAAQAVDYSTPDMSRVVGPDASDVGTLTEPREFNLMFQTQIGALLDEENIAFLRPETAQGMFVNFKNVLDSSRVKIPFGIAQIGKSFRNEITPRNYTFRSREFEQMEMEFFCHPEESRVWYEYWRNRRFQWYVKHGITSDNLRLRDHEPDELSHYSVGTADVEYAFPFLEQGEFGELEGIAHRGDFDLRSHMEGKLVKDENGCLVVELDEQGQPKYRGSGRDLAYFDDQTREKFIPHVIEPAAGADRTTLAFLCEAFAEDEQPDEKGKLQKRTLMQFHPKIAPVKAAVFPLIKKEGMPEQAAAIYHELKKAGIAVFYDQQGAIGRRYRRQDEIGTPFCITVDGVTAGDNRVTVRDRDSLKQERVPVDEVVACIRERLEG